MANQNPKQDKQNSFWESLLCKHELRHGGMGNNPDEPNLCTCDPCEIKPPKGRSPGHTDSLFSLNSTDLEYISKLKQVLENEKQVKQQIEKIEKDRNKGFMSRLWPSKEKEDEPQCECKKETEELMRENKRLTDELLDLKLEMKHCIEKMEGPIARHIQSEKCKNEFLERELMEANQKAISAEEAHIAETNALRMQLQNACQQLCEINAINAQMKEELAALESRCEELQDEMIKQKLNEAQTIKSLLDKQRPSSPKDACSCTAKMKNTAAGDDPDTLDSIGKQLSKALQEADECRQCEYTIPPDLKDTARGIKDLLDIVGGRGKDYIEDKNECPCDEPVKDAHPPCPCELPLPKCPWEPVKDTHPPCHCELPLPKCPWEHIPYKPKPKLEKNMQVCPCHDSGTQAEPPKQKQTGTCKPEPEPKQCCTCCDTATQSEPAPVPEPEKCECPPEEPEPLPEPECSCKPEPPVEEPKKDVCCCDDTKPPEEPPPPPPPKKCACSPRKPKEEEKPEKKPCKCCVKKEPPPPPEPPKPCPAACAKHKPEDEDIEIDVRMQTEGNIDVEATAEVDYLPDGGQDEGILVTTAVTNSGTLEVITEGPAGKIETTMTYTESGNIEVLTEITEFEDGGQNQKAIEAPPKTDGSGFFRKPASDLEPGGKQVEIQPSAVGEDAGISKSENAYFADISAVVSGATLPDRTPEADNTLPEEKAAETPETEQPIPEEVKEIAEQPDSQGVQDAPPEVAQTEEAENASPEASAVTEEPGKPEESPINEVPIEAHSEPDAPKEAAEETAAEALVEEPPPVEQKEHDESKPEDVVPVEEKEPEAPVTEDVQNEPDVPKEAALTEETMVEEELQATDLGEVAPPTATDELQQKEQKAAVDEPSLPEEGPAEPAPTVAEPTNVQHTCAYLSSTEEDDQPSAEEINIKIAIEADGIGMLGLFLQNLEISTDRENATEDENNEPEETQNEEETVKVELTMEIDQTIGTDDESASNAGPEDAEEQEDEKRPSTCECQNQQDEEDIAESQERKFSRYASMEDLSRQTKATPNKGRPSKIPVAGRRKRRTKVKCDCPTDCQCEVCSSDIMKQREIKQGEQKEQPCVKTGVLSSGDEARPDDCNCNPPDENNHPPDCTCVSCLCDPRCGDSTKGKPESGIPTNCVLCGGESSPNATLVTKQSAEQHSKNCSCEDCLCLFGIAPKQPEEHPLDCSCIDCLCKECPDAIEAKKTEECTCEEPKEPTPVCSCIDCTCEGCSDAIKPIAADSEGCQCINCQCCQCKPCQLVNQITQTVPPDVTKETSCSCLLEQTELEIETERIMPVDKEGKCNCPEGNTPTVVEQGPICDCDLCNCESCPGVNMTKKVEPDEEDDLDEGKDPDVEEDPDGEEDPEGEEDPDGEEDPVEKMESEDQELKNEMNDLKNSLEQIRCACAAAEKQAVSHHQIAPLQTTMSGLQVALANMEDKCKVKDQMIQALTKELKLRADSKVFDNMLANMSKNPPPAKDYKRMDVCDSLPRPGSEKARVCSEPNSPSCPFHGAKPPASSGKPPDSSRKPPGDGCPCDGPNLAQKPSALKPPPVLKSNPKSPPNCDCDNEAPPAKKKPSCPCDEALPPPVQKSNLKSSQNCDCDDEAPPAKKKPSCPFEEALPPPPPVQKSNPKSAPNCDCDDEPPPAKKKPSCPCDEALPPKPPAKPQKKPTCPCEEPKSRSGSPSGKREIPVLPLTPKISAIKPPDGCICPGGGVSVNPLPMDITDVRKVAPDSLLIKWNPSANEQVTGYEIEIDGVVKSRVFSTNRTKAVIDGLDIRADVMIDVFALTKAGRCLPAARAIFHL